MIQKLLLYLFLFLLPIQTVYFLREPFVGGVKWEYGVVAIYGTDILLLLLFIVAAIAYWRRSIDFGFMIYEWRLPPLFSVLKSKIINHKSEMFLIAFLLWAGLSILWALDTVLAGYFFVKLLLGAGLFLVVRGMEISVKKVVFVLLVAGVVQSGIGVAQFLYQESPGSSFLGISQHEAWQAGSSVLKIDSGRFLRAYGTFPHPNVLGGFLGAVLMMGIAYYVFRITYRKSWSTFFEILYFLSGSMIIFLGFILTFSRAAWLGVLLGIIVIGFHAFRQDDFWIRRRFLKIVFALGLAGLVFGSILYEQIFPRFDTMTIEREGSVSERVVSLQDARRLIGEHPLIGMGAGNFTAEILKRGEMGVKGERGEMGSRPVWSIQPAHNVFILIFAELGVIGLSLFVGFLISLLFSISQSVICNPKSAIPMALIPSLFLDHFLWSSHFGLLFFFLLLGLATRR